MTRYDLEDFLEGLKMILVIILVVLIIFGFTYGLFAMTCALDMHYTEKKIELLQEKGLLTEESMKILLEELKI